MGSNLAHTDDGPQVKEKPVFSHSLMTTGRKMFVVNLGGHRKSRASKWLVWKGHLYFQFFLSSHLWVPPLCAWSLGPLVCLLSPGEPANWEALKGGQTVPLSETPDSVGHCPLDVLDLFYPLGLLGFLLSGTEGLPCCLWEVNQTVCFLGTTGSCSPSSRCSACHCSLQSGLCSSPGWGGRREGLLSSLNSFPRVKSTLDSSCIFSSGHNRGQQGVIHRHPDDSSLGS